jgi:hypothetical protein
LRVQHPLDVRADDLPSDLDEVTIVSYVVDNLETFAFVVGPKRNGTGSSWFGRSPSPITTSGRR